MDRGGWAYLAAVSDAVNHSGLRTDTAEVLAVAGAIDEPRFEIAGKRVRARYGHTRQVEISYQVGSLPQTLFHGTASGNLNAIFAEGEGLRSMGRQWVHLSSDPTMALRTAERHGPGVLLALESDETSEEIFHAGGAVFLTPIVPASVLRIVSPTELFLTTAPARLSSRRADEDLRMSASRGHEVGEARRAWIVRAMTGRPFRRFRRHMGTRHGNRRDHRAGPHRR